eukprot:CAMPEP_0117575928 /NCGR_PEP_ID=MMETSP0784-20121206/62498_1 /TAXON_ID=39447 /ORGANISM="" /LENGTH=40 /DNA_ID= /DNA_START= /DNA_END= /DNA_ORIENTATION=
MVARRRAFASAAHNSAAVGAQEAQPRSAFHASRRRRIVAG